MNIIVLYSPGREGEVVSLGALLKLKEIPFLAEKSEPPGTQNWKVWIERLREAAYSVFLPGRDSWESPFWLWAAGYAAGAHEKSYLHSSEDIQTVFDQTVFDDFHFLKCGSFEELVQSLWEDHKHWLQRQDQRAAEAELILRNREISLTGAVFSIQDNLLEDFVLYLRYGISPNAVDRRGVGLIHHATRAGRLDFVRLLLERGADPDLISGDRGNTALMDACSLGNADLVRLLLTHPVKLEVESKNGQTALVLAVGARSVECAELLLKRGADPRHADRLGLDAIGYARLLGPDAMVRLFDATP